MFTRVLVRGLEWLLISILASMVILVFGNVVLRYGFNSGITFSEEVSRFLFVWMVFLGLRAHAP
jgi:TRAP-type C4-dicarboxylate transport system permease small subunit